MANAKKACRYCKECKQVHKMVTVPLGAYCNWAHAIAHGKALAEKKKVKVKAASDKVARVKHKADKERVKPLNEIKADAQRSFNKYVRLRDFYDDCISCNKSKEQIESDQGWKVGGAWDCGHYKSRGAKKQLRFNLWNCSKQCKSCNGGSGNFAHKAETVSKQYEINLRNKIGDDKVDLLNNNNDIVKFDREYCLRIKKIFNKKALILKKRIDAN
jgi:hypothetical protein|tara:strand:- start:2940 stop:3584 length:645 start_codon:yes stop_codon:yes gene_type:complete